jgi:hypothetical protein
MKHLIAHISSMCQLQCLMQRPL